MFDILGVLLEAMSGKAVPSGDAPGAAQSATRRMAQGMLEQAARMESSADPSVRKVGQEMRARATAVLNNTAQPAPQGAPVSAAAASVPAPRPSVVVRNVSVAAARPAAPARAAAPVAAAQPEVARHLLADAHSPAALLRTIVLMEALGAPLALRDELGGPFTHR
jgi:hypothetical protein